MKQPTVESFIQPDWVERAGDAINRIVNFLGLATIVGACVLFWIVTP